MHQFTKAVATAKKIQKLYGVSTTVVRIKDLFAVQVGDGKAVPEIVDGILITHAPSGRA